MAVYEATETCRHIFRIASVPKQNTRGVNNIRIGSWHQRHSMQRDESALKLSWIWLTATLQVLRVL